MMRTYAIALALVATLANPVRVTSPRPPDPIPVEDLTRTAVVSEAARSTAMLPFDLSAVRLRPEPSNRGGLQRSC